MDIQQMKSIADGIRANVEKVIVGKSHVIELVLAAMLAEGHVLLEDVPGTGKTMMAKALAKSIDTQFKRIQFTPDLLPSDLIGINYYNQKEGEFVFRQGALFTNVLLADEINRATPRTQSSLLESMEEKQITVDGTTYVLEKPFFVIATQNPVETQGTFPLPEAQLDRFLMRISLGYPTRAEEKEILERNMQGISPASLSSVMRVEELLALQEAFHQVRCAQSILDYIISLADATRHHEQIALGISPRGSLALMNAARAYALLQGRDFVQPDDVQKLIEPVFVHRIILQSQAVFRQQTPVLVLRSILREIPVPNIR